MKCPDNGSQCTQQGRSLQGAHQNIEPKQHDEHQIDIVGEEEGINLLRKILRFGGVVGRAHLVRRMPLNMEMFQRVRLPS